MTERPVCFITGASGGIASGIARRLAADGYALVLMSRSGCGDLAAKLGQVGVAGSVLEDADIDRAVAVAVDRFGRLDAAVFIGGRQGDILLNRYIDAVTSRDKCIPQLGPFRDDFELSEQ